MNGPQTWSRLLAVVRPIFGDTAVVAGGCIRDYHLGIAPKDIDVFVGALDEVTLRKQVRSLNTVPGFSVLVTEFGGNPDRKDYEQWSQGELVGVAEGIWYDYIANWTINIVARPDLSISPYNLVRKFDMGILQSFFDGHEVHHTTAALHDLAYRTATLMRPDTRDLSLERFERFNKRHPGLLTPVNFDLDPEDILA